VLDSGAHIGLAEIEAYAPGSGGDQPRLVDEYRFGDVAITGTKSSNGHNTLAFDFASFSHGHVDYDNAGKATSVSEGYDFAKAAAFDGPAPLPDINFFI
jgi:hypothetical protein